MTRLYWDFFGAHARGTAEHHARHVDEFADRNGLSGVTTGVTSEHPSHAAAYCDASGDHAEIIKRVLRPKRSEEL